MGHHGWTGLLVIVGVLQINLAAQMSGGGGQPAAAGETRPPTMALTTNAFPDGGEIPLQ